MRWMARRGVACHALDFRGCGGASGRRGFVARWEEYLDDLLAFLEVLRQPAGSSLPLFALGQSHGALVLAAAGVRGLPGVTGCIFTSPYFQGKMIVPRSKILLARVADRVLPWLPVPSNVPDAWMSSDESMVAEGRSDPLVLRIATPRWYLRMLSAQAQVLRRAEEFTLPLLLLMGGADPLADEDAARAFHERAGSVDKTFRLYPGCLHELLRERRREEVFWDILQWLRARISAAKVGPERAASSPPAP